MDFLFIILIVIVIMIFFIGSLVLRVFRAVRSLRNAANTKAVQFFSEMTEDLLPGNDGNISAEFMASDTPCSISDMTSVYAPMLAKDYPDLNLKQLISAAQSRLCASLYAIQDGSLEGAGTQTGTGEVSFDQEYFPGEKSWEAPFILGATPFFASQIQRQIESLVSEDKTEHFEKINIHKTGIYSYQKDAGTCVLTLQTAIEYLHYIEQNGVVVSGSMQVMEQARYNLLLLYVRDENRLPPSAANAVGVTCPNCGASVKGLGNRQCEYCSSALQVIDIRIWRMDQFSRS